MSKNFAHPKPRSLRSQDWFDNPNKIVDYGQTGRVMLTTLTRELFIPRFQPCERARIEGDETRHHRLRELPQMRHVEERIERQVDIALARVVIGPPVDGHRLVRDAGPEHY